MTAPIQDAQATRDNETEHAELASHDAAVAEDLGNGDGAALQSSVITAVLAREDLQHAEFMNKVQEAQSVLAREMGEDKVMARTRRHLYQQVLELRVLEYDQFENEEAFVLPLVRDQMIAFEE